MECSNANFKPDQRVVVPIVSAIIASFVADNGNLNAHILHLEV